MALEPSSIAMIAQVAIGAGQKIAGAKQRKKGLEGLADPYSPLLDIAYRDVDRKIKSFRTGQAFESILNQSAKASASGVKSSFSSGRGLISVINTLNRNVSGIATNIDANSNQLELAAMGVRNTLADKITQRFTDSDNYIATEQMLQGAQNSQAGNANIGAIMEVLGKMESFGTPRSGSVDISPASFASDAAGQVASVGGKSASGEASGLQSDYPASQEEYMIPDAIRGIKFD